MPNDQLERLLTEINDLRERVRAGDAARATLTDQVAALSQRVARLETRPPEPPADPPPPGAETAPAITLEEVTWLHRNVSSWRVTSTVTRAEIIQNRSDPDDGKIIIDHTKAGQWPARNDGKKNGEPILGEGNPWVFANVGGRWYAATYEWLKPGQIEKRITAAGEWGIGPHTKKEPLESWVPKSGEWIGLMVSGLCRDSRPVNVEERSNVVMVRWP